MINTKIINSQMINEPGLYADQQTLSDDLVSFNNFGLNNKSDTATKKYVTTRLEYEGLPNIAIDQFENPALAGQTVVNAFTRNRRVFVDGYIKADTEAELEKCIHTMNRHLRGYEGNLDIVNSCGRIRAIATLVNRSGAIRRRRHPRNKCIFNLEFEVHSGFFESLGYQTQQPENITAATLGDYEVLNDGVYDSFLITEFRINTAAALTRISATNNTTGKTMFVDMTDQKSTLPTKFEPGDLLTFDAESSIVTLTSAVNALTAEELKPGGVFLDLKAPVGSFGGENSIDIAVVSTSHDMDLITRTKYRY